MPKFLLRLATLIAIGPIGFMMPWQTFAEEISGAEASVSSEPSPQENKESEPEVNVPLAGHSEHGEAYNEGPRQNAYLMGGTGAINFPISTDNEKAQEFFDQGLGQLYGFWYYEAERSFRRVATLDPDCAMAYWGMARANDENKERAQSFIAEAVEKQESASDREKMYISALEKFLTEEGEEKSLRKDYTKALEKIIRKYPDDIEAKAMLAVHLWQSDRHGVPINSHQAIESLIGEVFRVEPMHSAHHFRIHLWDHEEPSQALASAAKCGQSAPTIAHMWHMPGHIYSRLKRYNDAVFQQEASARADHAHMMRDGVLPDQIHNYAHNNEWLIRNLVHLGRMNGALSLARNMLELPRHPKYNSFETDGMSSCKYGRRRLLQVLESFELWDDIIATSDTMYLAPTSDKAEQGKRWRSLGLAHYHRGEFGGVEICLNELESLLLQFDKAATKAGEDAACNKREEVNKADEESQEDVAPEESQEDVAPEIAEIEEINPIDDDSEQNISSKDTEKTGPNEPSRDDAGDDKGEGDEKRQKDLTKEEKEQQEEQCKQIEKARKRAERDARKGEKSIEKAIAELSGIQFLARGKTDEAIEQFKSSDIPKPRLAEYYFLAGDHKKSLELCEQAVKKGRNEVRPLAIQVDLLRRMGKLEEAKAAFAKLRTVAGTADLASPLLMRLAKLAKELEWPADWRTPPVIPDDVGVRPELTSLGPLRWSESPAVDWELPDHRGETVALADFHNRPVIVIFYLGAGCLHCVEQLHEFSPMIPEFRAAGVEVVAISTETPTRMSESLKDFSSKGDFPITLLANPELSIFKKYRVFDDFEDMPLHGTFLIDGKGKIRWRDISYEPFLEAEFLLEESKRILSLEPQQSE